MKLERRAAARAALYALSCVVVVSTTFLLGYAARAAQAPATGEAAILGTFWEAWHLVDEYFYGEPPTDTVRVRGAIAGSLATLNDPYTVLVEPQQHDREEEELRGSFGGIGALVSRTPDGRILLEPMEGRPAAEAGIQAGDELIAVDGVPITSDMPFDDVLAAVRGEAGKIVRLTVRRESLAEPLTFDVKRQEIVTPSVAWELAEPGIGYIRISIFNERTNQELEDAIAALQREQARAFVVDLRDNGGGLLEAGIDVASQFIEDGVVLYERKNDGNEKQYPVKDRGKLLREPIVVLVNGGTASASEIVAGAIQDYERGRLIGTRTFGKASVQLLFDLSDGSSLHITNAHWFTPSRQEINGVGLVPDIEVPITDQDRTNHVDPQRDRAIELLRQELG